MREKREERREREREVSPAFKKKWDGVREKLWEVVLPDGSKYSGPWCQKP